jgi:hypothetical protein
MYLIERHEREHCLSDCELLPLLNCAFREPYGTAERLATLRTLYELLMPPSAEANYSLLDRGRFAAIPRI